MSAKRAAFVTIGQSPRDDIVDEMRPFWPEGALTVSQFGALDGLSGTEIDALRPAGNEALLVSRLASGEEVVMRAAPVEKRVESLVRELSARDYDFMVLLCTGRFADLPRQPLVVEAQKAMDHGVAALVGASTRVGVLVPHEEQAASFTWDLHNETLVSHMSPYGALSPSVARGEAESRSEKPWGWGPAALMKALSPSVARGEAESRSEKPWGWGPAALMKALSPSVARGEAESRSEKPWGVAARELAEADVIALHCMGYTERTRVLVAAETGKPVLLARRLLASAIAQIL